MGGTNPSQPQQKGSEKPMAPIIDIEAGLPQQNTQMESPKFVYADDGTLMPTEMADRYYGTLGRPLEQRELRPRKLSGEDYNKPFTANEAAIMATATADMVAREVELKIKTNANKEPAGELINPAVERRGIKVMKKLMEALEPNATPEQLLAASIKYVQDLEKMFEDGRVDPLSQKYFEGELLAAQSAKRRLDMVNYEIGLSSSDNYDRLIAQHNDNLKRTAIATAELEIIRAQSRVPVQAHSPDNASSETVVPLRDRPMTEAEVTEQRTAVAKLFEGRKQKELLGIPEDSVERNKFAREFFGETQGPEAKVISVTKENIAVFREYFLKELLKNGRMALAARGRIQSHLEGVLGGQLGQPMPPGGPKRFAYEIVRSTTAGGNISPEVFNKMNAKQFAKEYLGIDVYETIPDYDNMFI